MRLVSLSMAVIIATLVGSAPSAAQEGPKVGVLGGVNLATFGGNDAQGAKTRTGVIGGIYASIDLSRQLALETGGYFTQRGSKATNDAGDGSLQIKLDYIEVPVIAVFRSRVRTSVTPFFGIGGAVGIRVGCGLTASGSNASVSTNCSLIEGGASSAFNSNDFGAVGQVGVDISHFRLMVRYNLGLTSIDGTGAEASIQNRTLSLMAGFTF